MSEAGSPESPLGHLSPDESARFASAKAKAISACMRTFAQGLSCLAPRATQPNEGDSSADSPLDFALAMLALGFDADDAIEVLVTLARAQRDEGEADPFYALAIEAAKACAFGFGPSGVASLAAAVESGRGSYESCMMIDRERAAPQPIESAEDIVVSGSVADGAFIRSAASIRVAGNVGAATLEAGGRIYVGGVVHGKDACAIGCGGALLARAVERARVSAGGDIELQAGSSYASLECGGDFDCEGSRGAIVGCAVIAGGSVRARRIGAPACDSTVVKAGRGARGNAAPSVTVLGRLYPGVSVEIAGRFMSVNTAYDGVRIEADGPMLRVARLSEEA